MTLVSSHHSAAPAWSRRVLFWDCLSVPPISENPDGMSVSGQGNHTSRKFLGGSIPRTSAGTRKLRTVYSEIRSPSSGWLDRAYPGQAACSARPRQAAEIWQDKHWSAAIIFANANPPASLQVFAGDGTVPPEAVSSAVNFQSAADLLHAESRLS